MTMPLNVPKIILKINVLSHLFISLFRFDSFRHESSPLSNFPRESTFLKVLGSLTSQYRFVVIFLPLTNLVEVETDLKLPIPPPPPPPNDEEEKDVIPPPPMSPNEVKPTKEHTLKTSVKLKEHAKLLINPVICWDVRTWIEWWEALPESWEASKTKQRSSHPVSACASLATAAATEEIIKGVVSWGGKHGTN